jgi:hypothetical protein
MQNVAPDNGKTLNRIIAFCLMVWVTWGLITCALLEYSFIIRSDVISQYAHMSMDLCVGVALFFAIPAIYTVLLKAVFKS